MAAVTNIHKLSPNKDGSKVILPLEAQSIPCLWLWIYYFNLCLFLWTFPLSFFLRIFDFAFMAHPDDPRKLFYVQLLTYSHLEKCFNQVGYIYRFQGCWSHWFQTFQSSLILVLSVRNFQVLLYLLCIHFHSVKIFSVFLIFFFYL
jgi:hypothetical protein